MSTLSVVLQEMIKLLQYAKAKDPIIFRIGTSGGIDVQPGTVVVSNRGYNGLLKETYDLVRKTKKNQFINMKSRHKFVLFTYSSRMTV